MLDIFLNILAIAGIVLLIILAILLILIFLVLFYPISYRIKGFKNQEEYEITANASWLLHIISVRLWYQKEFLYKIKLFGITLYPRKKKEKNKNPAVLEPSGKEIAEVDSPEDASTVLQADSKESEHQTSSHKFTKQEESSQSGISSDSTEEKKNIFHKIRYTFHNVCDKIKKIILNIRYYLDILNSKECARLFEKVKKYLCMIGKNALPGKIKADITFGAKQPDTTGYLLAVYSILYPYLGNNVLITPDFEQQILEGSFDMKGHITLYILLYIAIKIFFDKDLKVIIKKVKQGGIENGR